MIARIRLASEGISEGTPFKVQLRGGCVVGAVESRSSDVCVKCLRFEGWERVSAARAVAVASTQQKRRLFSKQFFHLQLLRQTKASLKLKNFTQTNRWSVFWSLYLNPVTWRHGIPMSKCAVVNAMEMYSRRVAAVSNYSAFNRSIFSSTFAIKIECEKINSAATQMRKVNCGWLLETREHVRDSREKTTTTFIHWNDWATFLQIMCLILFALNALETKEHA